MSTPSLEGKTVLIVGLGASGASAALLCKKQAARVIGIDRKGEAELEPFLPSLREAQVDLHLGTDEYQKQVDLVVASPGVPKSNPAIQRRLQQGVPVVSEIELASWYCTGPIIAVTGTDGKSTVVSLIYEALRAQNCPCRLAGNIGYSFSRMLLEQPVDEKTLCVVEVSSYQLEFIRDFRPFISVILNIASDHLNRHGTIETYRQAKYRITENQTHSDWLVRPISLPGSYQSQAQVLFWSSHAHDMQGASFDPTTGKVRIKFQANETELNLPELKTRMPHSVCNILAALAAQLPLAVSPAESLKNMLSFAGLPHRLEYLGKWSGVSYYNDSKATNVNSCRAALEGVQEPIVLLAGGQAKEEDYRELLPLVESKVRLAIVFGQARDTLEKAWQGTVDIVNVPQLEQAVTLAIEKARPGDTVLLSPACASFDRFHNFEQRGNFFKSLVNELVIEKKT
jgi:UDP-N-acetylmuramoylalanine--D-glutamate ligase